MASLLQVLLLAALLVAVRSGSAVASTKLSGPIRVDNGDSVACVAANAGPRAASKIEIHMRFNSTNGGDNNSLSTTCTDVAAHHSCPRTGLGNATDLSVYCEVSSVGGKVRSTICNTTKGLCSDVK